MGDDESGARPAHLCAVGLVKALPTSERFLQMRIAAQEGGTQNDLHKLVSAWQAVAVKCNLAFEQLTRLAIYRLEVERDLGAYLAQSIERGGDRRTYPRGRLDRRRGLPDNISWKQSSAYQRLAKIPEDIFRAYLDAALAKHAVPSSAGARAFAAPPRVPARHGGKCGKHVPTNLDLPPAVIQRVVSIMTPDVVVGGLRTLAKESHQADESDASTSLTGDVFVAACDDPDKWLRAIDIARRHSRLRRVIIALPAYTWTDWFHRVGHGDWLLCFLRQYRDTSGSGLVLGYSGEKPSMFRLAFRSLGVVLRAATVE